MTEPVASEAAAAYLRLAMCRGFGPVLITRLVDHFGDVHRACQATHHQLSKIEGFGPGRAAALSAAIAGADVQTIIEGCSASAIRLICRDDPAWPMALRQIPDPPIVLFLRGDIAPEDTLAVAVVGARNCTLYGREQAEKVGRELAQAGLTVVSGGARGIDTAAHWGALRARGRTIVVTGCGLGHCYPPENDQLYQEILDRRAGCILSEMLPDEPPLAENFPPRNRIIAGLALGTLVVEANLRSGSMITARLAADDYGREVFAMPGRVDSPCSSGTHHLIKIGGAQLVESAQDILESLHLVSDGQATSPPHSPPDLSPPNTAPITGAMAAAPQRTPNSRQRPTPRSQPLSPESAGNSAAANFAQDAEADAEPLIFSGPQSKIIAAMAGEKPVSIDELCQLTELPAAVIVADLTMLELRGIVKRTPDRLFRRCDDLLRNAIHHG